VHDHCPYDYAIIRVVPKVEREEFINVGVIVSCPARGFLEARIDVDEQRLRALDATLDIDSLRLHLATIPDICTGGEQAGPEDEPSLLAGEPAAINRMLPVLDRNRILSTIMSLAAYPTRYYTSTSGVKRHLDPSLAAIRRAYGNTLVIVDRSVI